MLTDARLDLDVDDPRRPILLAVSDNGPPMKAQNTRAFMVLMAIAQHHGRPHTPTDQAWIESFFGYVTPDDEHHGRGDAIRQARREGLDRARRHRLDYHRTSTATPTPTTP